uniref:Uncharacterized protein n=1 Tax=Anguilla anguilla TaxID=7936 RepID=A0A0E9VGY2_ANGAN
MPALVSLLRSTDPVWRWRWNLGPFSCIPVGEAAGRLAWTHL